MMDFEVKYGLCVCLLSAVFFKFVKTVLVYVGPPKSMLKDVQIWNNISVSCIHAFICSVGVICSFVLYPDEFKDLSLQGNTFIYLTVCMSVGYFIYDTLDILLQKNKSSLFVMLSHHAVVIGLFSHNILLKLCLPYTIVGLLAEVNSVFLHLRKLLQMANMWTSREYAFIVMLNLFTFVVFRGWAIWWSGYTVLFDLYGKVPLPSYVFVCLTTVAIDLVNIKFFWKILKNDYLKKPTIVRSELLNGVCIDVTREKIQ
ncbi:TLC domain-containing protein 2-like [Gigantopelta aegis]|uniref:TLC domain-containing protein 2-like n=1 Tax=Gigantopelta aegis TaxID=1735272 RepID=UPI001B88E3B7|nr:TLC domain-containing protein 2-like [Gigantopelta aegis]XP_041354869.1 TLC domain-containing protein 2-like [Gigantopelta aegis]